MHLKVYMFSMVKFSKNESCTIPEDISGVMSGELGMFLPRMVYKCLEL